MTPPLCTPNLGATPTHRLRAASSLEVPRCGVGRRGVGAVLPFSGSSGALDGVGVGGSAPGGFLTMDLGDRNGGGGHRAGGVVLQWTRTLYIVLQGGSERCNMRQDATQQPAWML